MAERRRRVRAARRAPEDEPSAGRWEPALWLLACLLPVSLLALGAQHVEVIVPLALLSVGGAAWLVLGRGARVPWAAALLFGLAAWTALQAVPLPEAVTALVSPAGAAVWRSARELVGAPSGAMALSLDPGASWVEATKHAAYAGVIVLAAEASRVRGLASVLSVVVGSGVLLVVVTLAHGLLGLDLLYGIYDPVLAVGPWSTSPLLNPNNRAGYLQLGAFCALALALSRRQARLRPLALVAAALLLILALLAASRGAYVALAAGVLLLGVAGVGFLRRARAGATLALTRAAPLAAALGLAGLGAWALSGKYQAGALADADLSKVDTARVVLGVIAEYPVAGLGRGAFETAFPAYRTTGGSLVDQYVENVALQWMVDWGVPAAIVAFGLLAYWLRPRRGDSAARTVARIAVAVLVLHNAVDMGLELMGVALAAFAVIGALVAESRSVGRAHAVALGGAALGAGVALLAATQGRTSARQQREGLAAELRAVRRAPEDERRRFLEEVRAAILRRPADPYAPIIAARVLLGLRDPAAMRYVGHALERDPASGEPHLLVATVAARRGNRSQALLSLRLAVERDEKLADAAAARALRWARDGADLLRAAPMSNAGARMLLRAAKDPRFEADQLTLLEEAAARGPAMIEAQRDAAGALLDAVEALRAPCGEGERDRCLTRAEAAAKAYDAARPNDAEPLVFRARVLVGRGLIDEAKRLLEGDCPRRSRPARCLKARVTLDAAERWSTDLDRTLRALEATECAAPEQCARVREWIARELTQRGEHLAALEYWGRAVEAAPTPARWTGLADSAAAANQPGRAKEAMARARAGIARGASAVGDGSAPPAASQAQ
ncbi:MAG: hypothetical protein IT376_04175 [Polyangiaceae bacterium]|nr:hypothetical protein [Polyangiaceae bacterium]